MVDIYQQGRALIFSFEELWDLELYAKENAAPFNKVTTLKGAAWNSFFSVLLVLSIYLLRSAEWGWVGGIMIIGPGFWFVNLLENYGVYRVAQKDLEFIRWKDFDLRLQWRLLGHHDADMNNLKLRKLDGRGIDWGSKEVNEWWYSITAVRLKIEQI